MNVRKTFLQLTQKTYPHGTEDQLLPFLPKGYEKDDLGNYFIKIGETSTMFTCHLDTACSEQKNVNHKIGSRFIETDGKTILGADDKAGMTVMLYMIENKVPGLYYFFIGEEVGCIGSNAASGYYNFSDYTKCISFDRRGYDSVITEQFYGVCCSDEFAKEIATQLNKANLLFKFRPDPTGIMTDSASFMGDIPECTNISVGYFDEHKHIEKQDIQFLVNLCEAVVKVDWESLPVMRDPNDSYSYGWSSSSSSSSSTSSSSGSLSTTINVWIDDVKWRAKLSNQRIIEERSAIYAWILHQDGYPDLTQVNWDGQTCEIEYGGGSEYIGDRSDLIDLIPELDNIPLDCLDLITKLG